MQNRVAPFSDAPTSRGKRHLEHLAAAKRAGYRSFILFFAQRVHAKALTPKDETDPTFGDAFRDAVDKGVEALAYRLRIRGRNVELSRRLPILRTSRLAGIGSTPA